MTTYKITCNAHTAHAKERAETYTGTLNELREILLFEALHYDWDIEGYQDVIDNIEDGTADNAKEKQVIEIAAHVWDESPKHITLTKEGE